MAAGNLVSRWRLGLGARRRATMELSSIPIARRLVADALRAWRRPRRRRAGVRRALQERQGRAREGRPTPSCSASPDRRARRRHGARREDARRRSEREAATIDLAPPTALRPAAGATSTLRLETEATPTPTKAAAVEPAAADASSRPRAKPVKFARADRDARAAGAAPVPPEAGTRPGKQVVLGTRRHPSRRSRHRAAARLRGRWRSKAAALAREPPDAAGVR